ncbi:MAG: peptide chain release factor N(5)-glutamine methyltransferase [Bacteroidetes bacterium]|nr:peptide chain release factor N(5)-glutamine methyltransferase [Bacteroidota bacterium]
MEYTPVAVKMILDEYRLKLAGKYELTEVMKFVCLLFEEWKGWNKATVHLNREMELTGEEGEKFRIALRQLEEYRPIQYIIGTVQFLDAKIRVREGVLIPRPETEELAGMILRDYHHRKNEILSLLDIGTGTGCIPVAVKKEMPQWTISAMDISGIALKLARENSRLNNSSVDYIQADILDRQSWESFPGYTIIISNPPYVRKSEIPGMLPNVLEYEPHEALFVTDEDPLQFFTAIARFSFLHLVRPGTLYLEINEQDGSRMRELLLESGFDSAEVLKDIRGKDRFARAELRTALPGPG